MSDERAHQIGDGPIEPQYVAKMRALAKELDYWLNDGKTGEDRDTGFCLLVFPFTGHEGRCNYISNADRKDMTVLLREQLARFEGRAGDKGKA